MSFLRIHKDYIFIDAAAVGVESATKRTIFNFMALLSHFVFILDLRTPCLGLNVIKINDDKDVNGWFSIIENQTPVDIPQANW